MDECCGSDPGLADRFVVRWGWLTMDERCGNEPGLADRRVPHCGIQHGGDMYLASTDGMGLLDPG